MPKEKRGTKQGARPVWSSIWKLGPRKLRVCVEIMTQAQRPRTKLLGLAALVGALVSAAGAPESVKAYGQDFTARAVGHAQSHDILERCAAWLAPRAAHNPELFLAHAIVVRTSPPQDGTATGDIGKVDVWYDAGIRDSLAALAVVGEAGQRVDKRDAAIDSADPAHVSVSVNPLTPGKYTVRYRALSADGHLVSGAWAFEVRP
jgi:copper resistance protein C